MNEVKPEVVVDATIEAPVVEKVKERQPDYFHGKIPVYIKNSKVSFWYQNKLVSKEEHEKLTNEEIRANNDLIRDYTK